MCSQIPRHSSTKHINKQGTKNSKVEHWDKGLEQIQETEEIEQGLDLAPILAQIGIGQDAIGAMNMTTLQENALTLCWMKNKMLFCSC